METFSKRIGLATVSAWLFPTNDLEQLEEYRKFFLGKDGLVKQLSQKLKEVPAESRKEAGELLKDYKQGVEAKYESYKKQLTNGN